MGARLGQHFLIDETVRDAVIESAYVGPADVVVEIGPGRGVLTEKLLTRAARLIAVEMDDRLAEKLKTRFQDRANFQLIHSDFLRLEPEAFGPGPVKFVANLPYAVATPILQRILSWRNWSLAVLMFQKEVAERIIARPGNGDYGILTLSVLLHAEAELVAEASSVCFAPRPKVDSTVVRLARRPEPMVSPEMEPIFFKVAKAAFTQRRKMAAGPIAKAFNLSREKVVAAFERCGIGPSCRAEEISFEAYLKLPAALGLV